MLILPARESLNTLKQHIISSQRHLPHELIWNHLSERETTQTASQLVIHLAKERLDWFKNHLTLINQVEAYLIEQPATQFQRTLQQQWRIQIEKIGDLAIDQAEIQKFALHCDFLGMGWSSITEISQQLKVRCHENIHTQHIDDFHGNFQKQMELLWESFFAFNQAESSEILSSSITNITRLHIEILEI